MRDRAFIVATIFLAPALFACGGFNFGNPGIAASADEVSGDGTADQGKHISISVAVVPDMNRDPGDQVGEDSGSVNAPGGLELAILQFDPLTLYYCDSSLAPTHVAFDLDILTGKFVPPDPEFELLGDVCRLSNRRVHSGSDFVARVAAASVDATGAEAAGAITVEAALEVDLDILLSQPIDLTMTNFIRIVVNPTDWFTGIGLAGADVDEDGSIHLTSKDNAALASVVAENVRRSIRIESGP